MLFTLSPFLPVQSSIWPLLSSISLFSLLSNIILWSLGKVSLNSFLLTVLLVASLIFLWWKDLKIESLLGYHTHKLEVSLRLGILLFILSEVFFFLSFFWAFYDASLAPSIELGLSWPPKGVVPLSVYSVPLLNTIILLSRGITVTWAHHAIINNFYSKAVVRLFTTVFLGAYFLFIQWMEYNEAMFAIADGVYGRTFFMATGFHGIHVIVGTTFLLVTLISLLNSHLTYDHHFSFEAAAWYWHFVDVVWLILFISIYWWGRL